MVAGEGAERVPGDLRVVMTVVVDEARADHPALGIDGLAGRSGQFAHLDDLAVLDRDIAVEPRHAGSVDDAAVANQYVIRHRCSSSVMSRELPPICRNYNTPPPARRRFVCAPAMRRAGKRVRGIDRTAGVSPACRPEAGGPTGR